MPIDRNKLIQEGQARMQARNKPAVMPDAQTPAPKPIPQVQPETTGQMLEKLQKETVDIVNRLKTANRNSPSAYATSAYVKEGGYYRGGQDSEYDELLKQSAEITRKTKSVYDAHSYTKNAMFEYANGNFQGAKDQIKKADNLIHNDQSIFKNWDGVKDLNNLKDKIVVKQNQFDVSEYQKIVNSPLPPTDKDITRLATIGIERANMDANNPFYNDYSAFKYRDALKNGTLDLNNSAGVYEALMHTQSLISTAYQERLTPQKLKGDELSKAIESRNLKLESLSKIVPKTQEELTRIKSQFDSLKQENDRDITQIKEIEGQFHKADEELKAFNSKVLTSDYAKMRKTYDNYLSMLPESSNVTKGTTRLTNVAIETLSPIFNLVNAEGSIKETDFKLDFSNSNITWDTGKADKDGNPVLSDTFIYKGVDGKNNYQWGAGLQTAGVQGIQMLATAGVTKAFAGAISAMSKIAGAGVSQAAILNSQIGVRALTLPAVYMTTYPKTYYDNIGNFKSTGELKDYTRASSGMEAFSESFIPDYNIVKGLPTSLPKNLSAVQLKYYTKYLKDLAKGTTSSKFWKTALQTAGSTINKTIQEAIVEEEINYFTNAVYQDYKKREDNGDNNYREDQEYTFQGALDLALEGTLTMLPSMLLTSGADYKHFKNQNNYNFQKPESLSYHRWNVATNANYFRQAIAKDAELTPEEKAKISNGINQYENKLKEAVSLVKKPDVKTLANDAENTFMYFDAISNKERIEPLILGETVSDEDRELFSNSEKVIALIQKENIDWMKKSPQERQTMWFNQWGEKLTTTPFNNLSNSTFASLSNISNKREQLNNLYQNKQLSKEMYDRYIQQLNKAEVKIPASSLEVFEANLTDINNPKMAAYDIEFLAKYDLPLAMKQAPNPEEYYKQKIQVLSNAHNKALQAEEKVEEKEIATPTSSVEENPEITSISKFESLYAIEDPKERRQAILKHFESVPKESLNQEIIEYTNEQSPENTEKLKEALWNKDYKLASILVSPAIENFVLSLESKQNESLFNTLANEKGELPSDEELGIGETKKEMVETPSMTIPEEATSEDNEGDKDGIDVRPTSGLITISDEYDSEQNKQDTEFSNNINDFLRILKGNEDKFSGKLVSNVTLFTNLQINIPAIEEILNRYWNKEFTYDEALKLLVPEFKGAISPSAIGWHLTDDISDVNKQVYGLNNPQAKFRDVTLKSFSFIVLNKSSNKIHRHGNQPIVRSLPKVKKIGNEFQFYVIKPLDNSSIQSELAQLYELQELYKDDQTLPSILVNIDKVSNGFNIFDAIEVALEGTPIVITQDRPGLKKGMVVDEKNRRLWSKKLTPEDVSVIAHIIANNISQYDEYRYQLVYLTSDEKITLSKLSEKEIKDSFLKDKRYNVVGSLLNNPFRHLTLQEGNLVPGKEREYIDFVSIKLFRYEAKKEIRNGNKKIYFSVATQPVELQPLVETKPKTPEASVEDSFAAMTPRTNVPTTVGVLKAQIVASETKIEDLQVSKLDADEEEIISIQKNIDAGYQYISELHSAINAAMNPVTIPAPVEGEISFTPINIVPPITIRPSTNFDALNFPSNIIDNTTLEEEQKAFTWFKNSFISKGFELNLAFTANPLAFANFSNTAITLFTGSNHTMLYHEAWHRFTQHYLSKKEKDALYDAVALLLKSQKEFNLRDYEEQLAEAFREYMRGGTTITLKLGDVIHTINSNKPAEKSSKLVTWFNKFKAWLTKLWTKDNNIKTAENLISSYIREASRPRSLRKSDVSNTYFKSLNTPRPFLTAEGEYVSLDYAAVYEMNQALDYLFVETFNELAPNNNVSALITASKDLKADLGRQVYDIVLEKIKAKRENSLEDKQKEFDAIINNYETYFVQEASDFRQSLTGYLQEKTDDELEELQDDETRGLNAEFYENLSNYQHAPEEVINVVKILPKMDNKGNLIPSIYWGLPQLDDFNKNWTILSKNLVGLDFPEMIEKIKSLSVEYPQFKFLLKNIDVDYTQGKLTPIILRNKFQAVFSMANVQEMITLVSKDENGGMVVKFIESGTNLPKEIQRQWDGDFSSPYQDITNGDRVLNIQRLLDAFPKLDNLPDNIKFLEAIGASYTNNIIPRLEKDQNDPKSKYYDFAGAVSRIYKKLEALNKSGEIVVNPFEAISTPHNDGKIWGESDSVDLVASLEVDTNETLSDDQMVRADGNQSWKYMQRSYVTNIVLDLDKLSYDELKIKYPQFDTEKNPEIINAAWFNNIFKYVNGSYTKRNDKEVYLEFVKTGGLKSEDVEEGEVTIDLTSSDKLSMDFYSFLTSGVEEAVRFADKSTTGAFKMNYRDGFNITLKSPIERQLARVKEQISRQIIGEIVAIQHIRGLSEDQKKQLRFYEDNYVDRMDQSPEENKKNKGLKFIYAEKIIPKPLHSQLSKTKLNREDTGYYTFASNTDKRMIDGFIDEYFKDKAFEFKAAFDLAHGNNALDYSKQFPSKFANIDPLQVFEYYYAYSTMNRIEQFNFLYGSPRNYKNGDDVFKRIAAYGAVGKYAAIDTQFLHWINSQSEYQRNIEALYNNGEKRPFDSTFSMVHFHDERVTLPNSSQEELAKNTTLTAEEKKQIENYYNKGDQTDASGSCTLDFYRQFLISIGQWNNPQNNAYNLQLKFEQAKHAYNTEKIEANFNQLELARINANSAITDLTSIFNVKKLQYAGSIISNHTIANNMDVRAFEKFSVAPIIPSVAYGTKWEKISENMYRTHTDMTNFITGTKMNWDQEAQRLSKWSDSSITGFVPSTLQLSSLKEQLPIENEMKSTGIFASQMRKLLSVGLFEKGKPMEGRESALYHYDKYKQSVNNITELIKKKLAIQFSSPEKLVDYIISEFSKRDIPDHVREFVEYYAEGDRLKDPLDLSFQSFQLQNVLFSIVNNEIVKQKYSGGQFIQAPNTAYTNATEEDISEYGQGDLDFYHEDPITGEINPMEIKISFSPKYHSLLKLKFKGEIIGDLDKLNIAIADKNWVADNKEKITLVGCRIPVQGFSTIEAMRIRKFLPPVAGQIVIVPSGLTIKSGSDFDIDKLNIYEPRLDQEGNLLDIEDETALESYEIASKTIEDNNIRRQEIHNRLTNLNQAIQEEEEEAETSVSEDIFAAFSGKMSLEDLQEQGKEDKKIISTLAKESKDEIDSLKSENRILKASNKEWKKYQSSILPSQVNQLISSISNIILDRGNYENLITKNEPDNLEREYELKGITKNSLSIGDIVDPLTSNQVFEKNTVGKASLGIDAKSNTFFALALEAGLKINNPSPSIFQQNLNSDGSLSLSTIYTQPSIVGKKGYFDKLYIPKILAEFISGHVDIAKDSRISEIRADRLRTPLYLYMIMSGVHLHDAVNFLSLPHILKLVEDYKRQDSIIYKNYITSKFKDTAIFELLKSKVLVDELTRFSPEIKNYSVIKNKKIDVYETAKRVIAEKTNSTTKELVDIAQFIVLLEDQNKFKGLTSAISWDTATSKSFVEMAYPQKQLDDIKSNGWFNLEAVEHFENESIIASLNPASFVKEYFSDSFSIIDRPAFIENTLAVFDTVYGHKLENFSRDFQNDFLTYLFQNYSKLESGESAYQKLILDLNLLDKDNPKNIQNRFNDVIKNIQDPSLQTNSFVTKLSFRKDKKSNTIAPELKNSNIDPHTANLIYYDLLKLLNPDFKTTSEGNELLRKTTLALIESVSLKDGVNKTLRGFQSLIPTNTYTDSFRDMIPQLSAELDDINSPLYTKFIGVYDSVSETYKGGMFQQNRNKYFPRSKRTKDYNPTDRFNYFIKESDIAESITQEDIDNLPCQ